MIVFATLFVCGGVYPITLLSAWCDAFAAERTTVLVVGGCDVHCCETSVIRRINNSVPTVGGGTKGTSISIISLNCGGCQQQR
jgi:hypothetical protein